MKLNKNTLLLILAVVLFSAAGKIALISKAMWSSLVSANLQAAAVQEEMARAVAIQKAVMATIPVDKGHLNKIRTVIAHGSIALYNLALANHLIVGILSIEGAAQGDIALDAVAKSLPMTHDSIKRITLLMKVNFNNLTSLGDFIEKIPDTGGYLSDIKIKGNGAALTVKYIGI
ncbi:MAG: hypothetical protein ACYCSS_00895 [Sulfuriferula sp.]